MGWVPALQHRKAGVLGCCVLGWLLGPWGDPSHIGEETVRGSLMPDCRRVSLCKQRRSCHQL